MSNQYQFYFSVQTPDYKHFCAQFNVDARNAPQLRSYDKCDSGMIAAMVGGVIEHGALRIDTDRQRLAQHIAEILTENILNSIKASDTINGYAKETVVSS